jgi:hypothetical protein
MKTHSFHILSILLVLFLTTSCDPALTIKIDNYSGQDLHVSIDARTCYFIRGQMFFGIDTTHTVILDANEGSTTLVLGIGTWQIEDTSIVENCLSTMVYDNQMNPIDHGHFNSSYSINGLMNNVLEVELDQATP